MTDRQTYSSISLFSGAGGMDVGFARAGFQSKVVCEVDKDACGTLSANLSLIGHKSNIINPSDILSIDYETLPKEVNVIFGGPPCQGFSLLNKKRIGDVRRELWQPYMDLVLRSGAKIFIIENVAGLIGSPELEKIQNRANEIGFNLTSAHLFAADYGSPQARKRAIVMGWQKNLEAPAFPPMRTHVDPSIPGSNLPNWRTVRDAIGDLPEPVGTEIRDTSAPFDLHFGRNPTDLSKKRYAAVPEGGNRFDLQRIAPELTPGCWIRKTSGGTDLFGRLWWDRPSVTIRTEFFKPEKGRYLHPTADRPITHREAARLMGFPDDFLFKGKKVEIAKQIGNAVPPHLAGAISRLVRHTLAYSDKGQAA